MASRMDLIDFTDCPQTKKAYSGTALMKYSVQYNGDLYMLKFSGRSKENQPQLYTGNVLSEYIGSHILNIIGIPAQETVLGLFRINNKVRFCVGCKDFTGKGYVIQDFAAEMNKTISSSKNRNGSELSSVLEAVRNQRFMKPEQLEKFFWSMVVGDALIENCDRNNGNWGFLYNQDTDSVRLAPLWDQGSSLYPEIDQAMMEAVIQDENEFRRQICEYPKSAIKQNGQRISFFEILSADEYPLCTAALKEALLHIDLNKISRMIDDIPVLNALQKKFYKYILQTRKELILERALTVIESRQKAQENPQ